MKFEKLLTPGEIGTLKLKNRFVVAPMGTNFGTKDGYITQQSIEYYKAKALGGYGLIIIEETAVDAGGSDNVNQIGLWEDGQIEGFKKLVDAIHENGAKVIVQLNHAGRETNDEKTFGMQPIAPSKIACPVCDCMPRSLSNEEIWNIINKYGDAAARAKEAGADGIELHGAHGYLIAQFMSSHSNRRYDDFGGDFNGRMKFPQEVIKNVKRKTGEDFPIIFRFSYDEKVHGGRTLEESIQVARVLEDEGVHALHVSIMTYASMHYLAPSPEIAKGFNQIPTKLIKNAVNIPVISVGRYDPFIAESALLNGYADFIAFGRASLADPEMPNKVLENRTDEIAPCIGCTQSCLGYIFPNGKISCLISPTTGHEFEYDLSLTTLSKKVLIVGSGPAGLMAAMIAAQKGHKVIVCEKQNEFGGQFRLASIPPTKQDIATAIKYYLTMGKKYGAEYYLNTEVDEKYISNSKPDAIILATGSKPLKPNIRGIDGKNVIDALDILDGRQSPGNKVLVVGGGMTGVETADFMGEHKRDVTILEMRPDIALDEAIIPRTFLLPRLQERGIKSICNATVKEITSDGVIYMQDGQERQLRGYDTIVLALGVRSYNPLETVAKALCSEVYVIGDAVETGPANKATESGLKAALSL